MAASVLEIYQEFDYIYREIDDIYFQYNTLCLYYYVLILFAIRFAKVIKTCQTIWLVPEATNLWFRRVIQAGILARVQRFSGVFSLVTYITCHMISQGN